MHRFSRKQILLVIFIIMIPCLFIITGCTLKDLTDKFNTMAPLSIPSRTTATVFTTATPKSSLTEVDDNIPVLRPSLAPEEKYKIQLVSREFIPEEGLQSCFQWLEQQELREIHALVQLYEIPDSEERVLLENSGVLLLDYIPSNSWFSLLPKNLDKESSIIELVRWCGPLLPEDKISETIRNDNIGSWAIGENNNLLLVITFFEDVKKEKIEKILNNYKTLQFKEWETVNKVRISIPPDQVMSLVEEDIVQWIDIIPPPPTIDQEGN